MKILFAPDSFKGSLSAQEICDIGEKACLDVFPQAEIIKLPMADGGEGTVDSILDGFQGEKVTVTVKNPVGFDHETFFGLFQEDKAIIEMASASGITLVEEKDRDIFRLNTYGTGQLILEAIGRGAKTIYLGIGGSATNDGGIGCLSALGMEFLDKNGQELEAIPQSFSKITRFNDEKLRQNLAGISFVIMSDVQNPLLGKEGATYVYGPQKGAKPEDLPLLEEGMSHYIQVVEEKLGRKIASVPGAGAAGGLGAGLFAFTQSEMRSGVETVLEILHMKEHLQGADLVVTGEGKMDDQSAFGKVAFGVGTLCQGQNVPCVAVVGGLGERYEEMYRHGISSIMTTTDRLMSLDEAVKKAPELCYGAMYRVFQMVQIGKNLK